LICGTQHPAPGGGIILSESDDLAAFQIDIDPSRHRFFLSDNAHVLQEVLVLWHPAIPIRSTLRGRISQRVLNVLQGLRDLEASELTHLRV
jgi:hypothetical protein